MKNDKKRINTEISVESVHGQPVDAADMINKYGTYQIQPTSDSENDFPMISGGLPKKINNPNPRQPK